MRVTEKIGRKIHREQKPRRLARKLSSRRRISGVMRRPRKVRVAGDAGSGASVDATPLGDSGGGTGACRSGGVNRRENRYDSAGTVLRAAVARPLRSR